MNRLLTRRDLATALAVPLSWVVRHSSILPRIRVGRYVRFDLEEVIAALRENGICGSGGQEARRTRAGERA